jgi:hypothetical protein
MRPWTHRRFERLLPLLDAFLLALALPLVACAAEPAPEAREPIVGLPCENCELVFVGMPATLSAHARIAPAGEPGEPLEIAGTVFDAAGKPVAGVIVYAYQTDTTGHYPPDPQGRHGRLRGWTKSDAEGHYTFTTVRPGGYPGTDIPQHVHMHVIEPGRCTYYIDDLLFDDDPRLSPEKRQAFDQGRGGSGIGKPTLWRDGIWRVRRDIQLGQKISGYPARP